MTYRIKLFQIAALLAVTACAEEPVAPPESASGGEATGISAGLPPVVSCDLAGCDRVIEASDDDALAAAARGARAGTCIALSPGAYGEVVLPGGVSVVGGSPEEVSLTAVTFGPGASARLCGVTVAGGGVRVLGAAAARIDAVRITHSAYAGVAVEDGASVDIVASEIDGSARYGVVAGEATRVGVHATVVAGGDGPGFWVACEDGCGCGARPELSMDHVIVRNNRVAGAALFGATATLDDVEITGTRTGGAWHRGQGGGGLSIAGCSSASAAGLRVAGSASYGVLVDDSTAALGDLGSTEGVDVGDNQIGIWLNDISRGAGHSVRVENARVHDNRGVGVGISGSSRSIIICRSRVTGTRAAGLPVRSLGSAAIEGEVGAGIWWTDGAEATLDWLTLGDNARSDLVIDGSARGFLTRVTIGRGDRKGMLQQRYTTGARPTVRDGSALRVSADAIYDVPVAPRGPGATL